LLSYFTRINTELIALMIIIESLESVHIVFGVWVKPKNRTQIIADRCHVLTHVMCQERSNYVSMAHVTESSGHVIGRVTRWETDTTWTRCQWDCQKTCLSLVSHLHTTPTILLSMWI